MSDLIQHRTRSLVFYGCGGTAINLLRAHRQDKPLHTNATSDERFVYVDTSIANLRDVSLEDAFIIEGCDGSGKDRPRNAKAVMEALPAILNKHKPGDTTVVVFSTAGGTGSVAGPIILEELLKRGVSVFAIVVGSHASLKATANTIGTLSGLEATVSRVGRPVVMAYRENDPTKSNGDNNAVPLMVMSSLSLLCSGKNGHLDSADVGNLADYHTVTHYKPALSMLDVYVNEEQLIKESNNVIAYAALLKNENEVAPSINPAYDTVGYLPPEASDRYNESFHFTVSSSRLKGILNKLIERRAELESAQSVVERQTSLLGDSAKVDSATGLVF